MKGKGETAGKVRRILIAPFCFPMFLAMLFRPWDTGNALVLSLKRILALNGNPMIGVGPAADASRNCSLGGVRL